MAITSPFAGRLTDRLSAKWVCLTGAALIGTGALLMFVLRSEINSLLSWIFFIFCLVVFGAGFGAIQSGSTVAAIQASPKEIAGVSTGFFHMIRFINASLGSTVFGILFENAPQNTAGSFYNSFLLIIALALVTIPFTFWIKAGHKAGVAARQAG
jgi:MFS family permease